MKRFIIHTALFCTVLLGTFAYILSRADGYSGAFYMKISSPKKTNLILGTSKAAQGIQPQILKEILHKNFYNYAFAIFASPYGETYLKSIESKLDTQKKDNIFILTVDPWSISSVTKSPNDSLNFREKESFLNEIKNVTQYPNFKYLIKFYDEKYYNILSKNSSAFLHNNGWLEVYLDEDKNSINRRTEFTLNDYKNKVEKYHFSEKRLSYLINTINYLNAYGVVYLVRLPVHPDLMEIEESVINDFNKVISPAISKSEMYIDLTKYNSELQYTDGVHLNKKSGEKITKLIAEKLK